MQLSIIVPTYNESPNVAELVRRVTAETDGIEAEIIFVDDSTDATPDVVQEVAASASLPVRLTTASTAPAGSAEPSSRGSRLPPRTRAW